MNAAQRRKSPTMLLSYRCTFVVVLAVLAAVREHVGAFGFDSANSCSPNGKTSRRGRAQMLAAIPCDLSRQAYCHLPGAAYPWHAVRRFVHENQGLMKRMYGEVRHISVLRDEIQNNDIDIEDVESAAARYSRDPALRRSSKFMHIRDHDDGGGQRNNDVLAEPHFRPATSTTPSPSPAQLPAAAPTPVSSAAAAKIKTTSATSVQEAQLGDPDRNLESNSVYGIPTHTTTKTTNTNTRTTTSTTATMSRPDSPTLDGALADNIAIVDSPRLGGGGGGGGGGGDVFANITASSLLTTSAATAATTVSPIRRPEAITTAASEPKPKPQSQQIYHRRRQPLQPYQPYEPSKLSPSHVKESFGTKLKTNESERIPNPVLVKGASSSSNNNNRNYYHYHQHQPQQKQPQHSPAPTASAAVSIKLKTTLLSAASPSPSPSPSPSLSASASPAPSPLLLTNAAASTSTPAPAPPTFTSTTLTSAAPTAASPALLPLKVNGAALLSGSGERLRKPATTSAPLPTAGPALGEASTKPVLRDAQLFQDTVKQEPVPLANLRGVNACPVKEEVVAPFWANNTRGEVLALLNLYPFEQYVHWEKCTHEHKQMYCRDGCRCEQQYRLHRLLAYDPHNECRGIFSDWFRFPSCCICKCYNIPMDFRATSRSPRSEGGSATDRRHPIDIAEEEVKQAIYQHAADEWYRPIDAFELYDEG